MMAAGIKQEQDQKGSDDLCEEQERQVLLRAGKAGYNS